MKRRWALALLVVLGACTSSGSADVKASDLPRLAAARSLAPRAFTSVHSFGGVELRVEGEVEDDYRYSARVLVDGRLAYEEVVADDRRYLRVHDVGGLMPAGGWLVDGAGAPAEFIPGKPAPVPLGPELVLQEVRALEAIGDVTAGGIHEWNTDSADYLPKDDKFPPHRQDGTRFDHVPSPWDPAAVVSAMADVREAFEYRAVWADATGVNRVERLMELPNRGDRRYAPLFDQLERVGSRRVREWLGGDLVVRSTFTVRPAPSAKIVEPEGAAPADLVAAVTDLRRRLAPVAPPTPLYGALE